MAGGGSTPVSRRGFVGAVAGTVATPYESGRADARTQDVQRTIDGTDSLVFDPDEATVTPGTTVVWETVGSVGHSVTAYGDEIPDDAEYFASDGSTARRPPGTPIRKGKSRAASRTSTFEVEGTYGYFCIPHEQVGMVAELTVSADTGGGDGGVPSIPENARIVGIVTMAAMISVVVLAHFFLKYGGDYGLE